MLVAAEHDRDRLGDVRHPGRDPVAGLHALGAHRRGDPRHELVQLARTSSTRRRPDSSVAIDRVRVIGPPQQVLGEVEPRVGEEPAPRIVPSPGSNAVAPGVPITPHVCHTARQNAPGSPIDRACSASKSAAPNRSRSAAMRDVPALSGSGVQTLAVTARS